MDASVVPATAPGRRLAWLMGLPVEPTATDIQAHLPVAAEDRGWVQTCSPSPPLPGASLVRSLTATTPCCVSYSTRDRALRGRPRSTQAGRLSHRSAGQPARYGPTWHVVSHRALFTWRPPGLSTQPAGHWTGPVGSSRLREFWRRLHLGTGPPTSASPIDMIGIRMKLQCLLSRHKGIFWSAWCPTVVEIETPGFKC